MSERGSISPVGAYARLVVAMALIAGSVAAGLWLGENWDDLQRLWGSEVDPEALGDEAPRPSESAATGEAHNPPLYFMASPPPGADLSVFLDEVTLAAGAGVNRVIVSVPVPWPGSASDTAAAVDRLRRVFAANPRASVLVRADLNPPATWLEQHASATVTVGGERQPYPCVASPAWLHDAQEALTALATAIDEAFPRERFEGCLLAALEQGQWYRTGGYDRCQDNASGFRQWLRLRYANDAELQAAWSDEAVTLDTAPVPEEPPPAESVFFKLPEMQRHVDFLQYTSDSTAQALATLAAHIKSLAGPEIAVAAAYGFHLELPGNDTGHWALARLLDSEVDCLVAPVSYRSRGVGGVGGTMGPMDSVVARGKRWILVDDTRTGAAPSADASANGEPQSGPSEDLYQVQRRNLVTALAHGAGLAWADPDGAGWLHNGAIWDRIGELREAYLSLDENEDGSSGAGENGGNPAPEGLYTRPTLMVVVDEQSRFYEHDDERLDGRLFPMCRDTALRSAVPVRFCLLQDVLRGTAPPASVYWFVNVFRLTLEQRGRLHEILARQQAAALWSYAPGYFEEGASVEAISATTRMNVKAFKKAAQSGSAFELAGKWTEKGEAFGEAETWDPLFYIDDPDASVLARYRDSGEASVALVYCDEGWKSVYIAEPALSPAVLRDILQLLEQHLYVRRTPPVAIDAVYAAPRFLAVHAGEAGERALDFGRVFDVEDLFDARVGWPRTRLISLRLHAGETRVLRVSPSTGLP